VSVPPRISEIFDEFATGGRATAPADRRFRHLAAGADRSGFGLAALTHRVCSKERHQQYTAWGDDHCGPQQHSKNLSHLLLRTVHFVCH
jgi:hypothetical protein